MYGYLPAALKANWRVSTLERYKSFLNDRIELVDFVNQISFVQEEDLDLDLFGGIVVARNPIEQLKFVQQTSAYKGHYFLEKPIGTTLSSSLELLKILESRVSTFSIAYLFRYQKWFKEILFGKSNDYNLVINWRVPHAKINSWKNEDNFGGGLLSYYGIHLLSLVVELMGDVDNLELFYKPDILRIESNESSKFLQIQLSTASSPAFEVSLSRLGGIYQWGGASPFGSIPISGIPDPRIPALAKYLSQPREARDSMNHILLERKIQELREAITRVL